MVLWLLSHSNTNVSGFTKYHKKTGWLSVTAMTARFTSRHIAFLGALNV